MKIRLSQANHMNLSLLVSVPTGELLCGPPADSIVLQVLPNGDWPATDRVQHHVTRPDLRIIFN